MKPDIDFQLPVLSKVGTSGGPRRLAWSLMGVFIIGVPALIFAPWVQNVSGVGTVVGTTPFERLQTIDTAVEGRVTKYYVVEGTKVKAGDLIAEVADNDPLILERLKEERNLISMRVDQAKSRVNAQEVAVQQNELSRRNALESARSRIKVAEDNIKAAQNSLISAEAVFTANKLNLDRVKIGLASGLFSQRQYEQQVQANASSEADVDRSKASLQASINEKLARDADYQKIETDFQNSIATANATLAAGKSDVANSAAEMQRVEVRVSRQQTQTVRAPRNGTVLRLLSQPGGELLKAGDSIASFVPETTNLVVELYMDGNDVPLIHAGDSARLQFEGWPAIQFAGWPSVAVGTFGGKVLLVDSTDNGKGKFRILVEPDPNSEIWPSTRYLRQGVRTNGWVLLNKVSLGYELWRQFNGFPPTVNPQMETGGMEGGVKK